ncbi:hypothetical protein [Sinomonas halotolerans]|uniref:Uncharacterized protein n=1 Tax=Sinomonas halotolerans TaxID=1644133 RepID=A0ABU9X2U7_9MICC
MSGRALGVGLNGYLIDVGAGIQQTLPSFMVLGLPDSALKEAREGITCSSSALRVPIW